MDGDGVGSLDQSRTLDASTDATSFIILTLSGNRVAGFSKDAYVA